MNIVDHIDDAVKVNHVLVSVSDKNGLDDLIRTLVRINPDVKIFSTGGTHTRIEEILGEGASGTLAQVSDYTGQPETQGGLVKTLDFKIYLGLLTETYNDAHQKDLDRTGGVAIDLVVANLYPFVQTIQKPGVTAEEARSNIDIGGPCMIRAAAKNFIRVASVVNPADYSEVISELENSDGMISLALRYRLAQKAFEHIAQYNRAIADYLASQPYETVKGCYSF